jgi:hypothetical protein
MKITSSREAAMHGVWNPASLWISVFINLWLIAGCQGNGNIGEYFHCSLLLQNNNYLTL